MIDFNGRLTLGITNYASGAGVWQKTLTADFTATPTRGAPPLTVQFTNTSAGDFTTSQWDFGDGGTSTETNPTHTYTVPGTYAVTLTVGDGTETSTITKPAYIVAKYFTYLPLVMKNYDPLLYDDFNDPTWDGRGIRRSGSSGGKRFQVRQENGAMVFSNPAPIRGSRDLALQRPGNRSLGAIADVRGASKDQQRPSGEALRRSGSSLPQIMACGHDMGYPLWLGGSRTTVGHVVLQCHVSSQGNTY